MLLLLGALAPVLDWLLLDPFGAWRLGSIAFGLAMVRLGVEIARERGSMPSQSPTLEPLAA